MNLGYILTPTSLTVVSKKDGKTYTMSADNANFKQATDALKLKDEDLVLKLMDLKVAVNKYTVGKVVVKDDAVYYDGIEINDGLTRHILAMMREGFDIAPLTLFMDKLQANPSMRAREQLFGFIQANKITIDTDGNLVLYKRVRDDYFDIHTGRTFRNKPGDFVQMPRSNVDDDPNRTCSRGLHVCSLAYLSHFGGERLVLCAVDPKDVVSIPVDYNNSKMRVAAYHVVGELQDDTTEFHEKAVYDPYGDDVTAEDETSAYNRGYEDGYDDGRGDSF